MPINNMRKNNTDAANNLDNRIIIDYWMAHIKKFNHYFSLCFTCYIRSAGNVKSLPSIKQNTAVNQKKVHKR